MLQPRGHLVSPIGRQTVSSSHEWEAKVVERYDGKEWRLYDVENKELLTALSRAQGKVENAKKLNKNPHFKSNYADLATIWDVIREPLTTEGLSVLQLPCEAPAGQVGLETIIGHSSGQVIRSRYYLALKDASNPQQAGSAFTYMKRYALLGVAGIASEDDDGNAATGRPSPAQPAVDYSKTIADTLAELSKATDAEAKVLYSTVRNSSMQQPHKDELLTKMADIIKARMAEAAAQKTEETPKKKVK